MAMTYCDYIAFLKATGIVKEGGWSIYHGSRHVVECYWSVSHDGIRITSTAWSRRVFRDISSLKELAEILEEAG